MINILHLYYDLLNLYGENANTRCIKRCLELNKIKANIDLKSIISKTRYGKDGVGGIITKGTMYTGYPR